MKFRRIRPPYAIQTQTLTIVFLPNSQTQQCFIVGLISFWVLLRPRKEFRVFAFFDNSGVDGRKSSEACQKEYLEGEIHCGCGDLNRFLCGRLLDRNLILSAKSMKWSGLWCHTTWSRSELLHQNPRRKSNAPMEVFFTPTEVFLISETS